MRLKWLQADWPIDMRALAARLRRHPYEHNSDTGYLLRRTRQDYLEATYVERLEEVATLADPLGETFSYRRTEFKETRFVARNGRLGLELEAPPRGLSSFVRSLSEICSFDVAIYEAHVDVIAWCSCIEDILNKRLCITRARVDSIVIDDDVTASALVRGSRDIRRHVKELTSGKGIYSMIQATADGGERFSITLTNAAAARFSGAVSDKQIDAVRTSALACITKI